MSAASLQCGEAGCRAVLGSVEGALRPPGHVADELSSPSSEVVKDLCPKGPVWCHLGPHHSQPLRLCRPGGVFLPLKDLGSVWLTCVHKCHSDGSLLGDAADIFRAKDTLVLSFLSLWLAQMCSLLLVFMGVLAQGLHSTTKIIPVPSASWVCG